MTREKKSFRRGDALFPLALEGVERCFDREAEAASPAADLLDKLAMVIEADERDRRPAKTHRRTRDSYSSFSVVK